jgi:predicted alpha/beta-fold hydrolase
MLKSRFAYVLCLLTLSPIFLRAEENVPNVASNTLLTVLPASHQLVGYDYTIEDGLYATITSMTSFKKPEIKDERKFKLDVDGFKKEIEVRAIIQDEPAPLVVIFLGLTSKSKDPLARLWQSQLQQAGFNVLCFDSVFRTSFNAKSCHGVAGNLDVEARIAAKVIHAFSQHPEVQGKITKIGLLGASYGGILALNFAKLADEKKIKVIPDRVLVFSPPVSMRISAVLLDKYFDEDRQKHGFLDLFKMQGHEPVQTGKPVPFSASLMRAGIGYVFHADLVDAIDCSREVYNYKLPDAPKTDNKSSNKNSRAFVRFIEEVVYPYWNKQAVVKSLGDLWDNGDLGKLLLACPDSVHAVITEDDPLNDATLLRYVQRDVPPSKLTVLPRGGHLGFVGCNWAKERVIQMFK